MEYLFILIPFIILFSRNKTKHKDYSYEIGLAKYYEEKRKDPDYNKESMRIGTWGSGGWAKIYNKFNIHIRDEYEYPWDYKDPWKEMVKEELEHYYQNLIKRTKQPNYSQNVSEDINFLVAKNYISDCISLKIYELTIN